MRKLPKDSKEKVSNPTKTKGGTNPRRRKSKGHDEEGPSPTVQNVRQGKPKEEVLTRVFEVKKLREGDKFTFLAPGKGKKTYICTVTGDMIYFERNDKHSYTRPLSELQSIINNCHLECKLI